MDNLRADVRDVVDDLLLQGVREPRPDLLGLRHGGVISWTRERNSRIVSRVHFVREVPILLAKLVERTGMRNRIVSR
jgi:hypothetical protein